jgi:hypothetical protein
MHKIIVTLLLLLGTSILNSCTNPLAKNEDFTTVTAAHRSALLSKMIPESFTNPNGQAKLSGNITAQINTGSFRAAFTTDSQIMGMDSDTTITLSGSTNTPELGGNVSMNLNLNTISKSGSWFLRINALDLVTENPAVSGMIWGFIESLKGKWFLLDGETAKINQPAKIDLARELRKSFAERNILIMTRDLGLENGVYRYEISLDKKELLELKKSITLASTGTGMTSTEIETVQKSLEVSNFTGTLMINQSNKEYGAMTLNYTLGNNGKTPVVSGSGDKKLGWLILQNPDSETGSISYNFSAEDIRLGFKSSKESLMLELNKNLTTYTGKITVTDQSKTYSAPIEISKDGDMYVLKSTYTATDKTEQIQSFDTILQLGYLSRSGNTINAPNGAVSLTEILGGFLGGGVGKNRQMGSNQLSDKLEQ